MSTKDQRTINMVHYPLGDDTDPRDLSEYLDDIDTATASKIGGTVGTTDNRVPKSSGTDGLTLSASGVTVDDSNNMSGVVTLSVTTLDPTNALAINKGGTANTTATAAFDALAPTTTQGDIIYHNGTDNVRLGPGTNGHFLQTQGAGANPQWAAAGAVVAVTAGALSNQATLDIAVGSTYDMYEFDLINFVPVTDNQSLMLRFSQSSSFLSGVSDYIWGRNAAGDEADSQIIVSTGGLGNQSTEGGTVTVRIFRPGASSFMKSAIWFGFGRSGTPASTGATGGGSLVANTNAIDGVRFLFATGNINTGYYAVRGYKFT